MKQLILNVAAICFYRLRRLSQVRLRVGQELPTQLAYVLACVVSRLDYCMISLSWPVCRTRCRMLLHDRSFKWTVVTIRYAGQSTTNSAPLCIRCTTKDLQHILTKLCNSLDVDQAESRPTRHCAVWCRGHSKCFCRRMCQSQKWPLSQNAHKSSGECSVCHAVLQLHNSNGTVHRHGPRNSSCPGSDKPRVAVRPYVPH